MFVSLLSLPMKFMDFQNLPFFNLFFFLSLSGLTHFFDTVFYDFPGGSNGKESACSAGDLCSIPGWEDPLVKEMTTHSSILAWKIPWTEEPSRLQSMGSQRVGHD